MRPDVGLEPIHKMDVVWAEGLSLNNKLRER